MSYDEPTQVCARSDCDRKVVFEAVEAREDTYDVTMVTHLGPRTAKGSFGFVAEGEPVAVCAEHLAEWIGIAESADPVVVRVVDLGAAHMMSEGMPSEVSYEAAEVPEPAEPAEPADALPDCGHGWVYPREAQARCGGPSICSLCKRDADAALVSVVRPAGGER